jgi:hypothetical protein
MAVTPLAATPKPLGGIPGMLNTIKSGVQNAVQGVAASFTPPKNITPGSYANTDPGVAAAMGKIAGWGQQYQGATPQMQTQIHDQAMAAGNAVGGVYNSGTGQWDFSNAKSTPGTNDTVVTPPPKTTTGQGNGQGSFPGQLTNAQIQAEAQARIDKQRAAITGATNAANAARKNVFDYTNQLTGDSRTLENGAFNETHNPFTGQTGYAQANLQRNRGIQDTANNNNYQADITANNQKLTDFETLAPGQQQQILDDLTKQERDYGLQVGSLTGQFNGGQTLAAKTADQNYQLGLSGLSGHLPSSAGGGQTQQAQNQQFNQNMQTDQVAYQKARDLISDQHYQATFDNNVKQQGLDYAIKQATLSNQITNDQAQRAIGYMNANTSQQNANTSATNSANSQSNIQSDNARADTAANAKNYQDTFSNLQSLYTAKDPYSGAMSVTNPQQLRAAILAKNFDDQTTIKMLSDFGLPIKQ